ncbi:PQQ-binding-like beta-propeller repeat protein [Thalassoroseus pseudoceratinae]|uniref:PQQ-binding-like beta-propeller repeat protein n=1 Tax=Thalassoroseus pseudoceratinae TaxID=2713176 RepID=UPI00141DD2A5|nr:PQQ-binding-like beta-propeller repeat protein [Thalassoroseus pseudoceratinae]
MLFSKLLPVCFVVFMTTSLHADDWPQWMGPNRDNVWREDGLLQTFPEGGPRVVWRVPIAGGYSGPAVANGRVYVMDYVTKENVKVDNFDRKQFSGTERVLCLNEATGKEIWKHEYPVRYRVSYPAGPRCTPNVHAGKVYTLGAEGDLYCLNAQTGEVVWSKNFPNEYQAKTPLWGFAAHPLIDGQKLICVVGGRDAHAVAFDKDTGREIWRALKTPQTGYVPPSIIDAGGVRQLILFHPSAVASVDPETGELYWSVPYEATNGAAIMTPVIEDNLLFAGSFSNNNILIELDETKPAAKPLWRDRSKKAISPVNVQPFLGDGTLYGFDQNGLMYGVELKTGDRLWQSGEPVNTKRPSNSATAFIVKNAEKFWMFNEHGELLIAKLSRQGYEEIDRVKVIEPTNNAFGRDVVWCPPAWANRKVYLRNDKECLCLDLAEN